MLTRRQVEAIDQETGRDNPVKREELTMGKISKEDISGMWDDEGRIVCADHMSDEDWNELTEDRVITSDEIERSDDLYFCHVDGKRL
jgi:hypothetical protein